MTTIQTQTTHFSCKPVVQLSSLSEDDLNSFKNNKEWLIEACKFLFLCNKIKMLAYCTDVQKE